MRYRAFLTFFVMVSVLAAGWLLFAAVDYSTAAFDCDIAGLFGPECAEAAQRQIANEIWLKGVAIIALWCIGLWLFIRERKKR